jgi:hypothetical protein
MATTPTITKDGTLLRTGSTTSLTTTAGTWTFKKTTGGHGDYQILLNGKSAGGGLALVLEVAKNGHMYAHNSAGGWYVWNNGWIKGASPNVLTVTSKQLTVAKNAAATPIKITAPTDSVFSATQLKVTATGLPSDGKVLLSDGKTVVTKGQVLTVSQLTGLEFKPTTNLTSGSSSFSYTVSDPAGTSKSGSVALVVSTSPTTTPSIPTPAGYSASQLIGEDKFTTSSLDTSKWSPWLGQNGGRWNGGSMALPNPYSSETLAGSPFNAEYYDPYPYAYATNTSGSHLVGGSGGLKITASPSSHFSSKDSDYKWASATISSTGHSSMILPATGGYVQVTAKIPDSSTGAWPFIWLLGEGSNRSQNVDWEFGYKGAPNSKIALGVNDKTVSTPTASVDLSKGYHTYGTKYVPGKSYSFYLDGAQIATTPTTNTGAFEVTLGLQMATAAASGWHSVSDTSAHPGPYTFAVSDVRVYRA